MVLASGCASYRWGEVDRNIPGGYRTVAVPVFKNRTQEAGIEVYFTNALVREIERGRIGRVVDSKDSETTLEGIIDSVTYTAPTKVEAESSNLNLPRGTVLTTEYRIFVHTVLRLRRNSDQKILWESSFDGERSYQAPRIGEAGLNSSNATYNQSARYQNIQAMASELMNEAHNRMTENF